MKLIRVGAGVTRESVVVADRTDFGQGFIISVVADRTDFGQGFMIQRRNHLGQHIMQSRDLHLQSAPHQGRRRPLPLA